MKIRNFTFDEVLRLLGDISISDIVDYYSSHSFRKTFEHFNIRSCYLKVIVEHLNLNKGRDSHKIRSFAATEAQEKIVNTNVKKYGVKYYTQTLEYKKRYEETCLSKYGVKNTFQLTDWHALYGIDNPTQLPEVAAKMKNTWLNKTDDDLSAIDKKRRSTCNDRYGKDYYLLTDDFKTKSLNTLLSKYGVTNISQVDEIKQKKVDKLRSSGVYDHYHSHSKKYVYEEEYFDSSWELALWIYAKDNNESIVHGKDVPVFTYEFNGKLHKYFPDFVYKGDIIDIKGDQFFDEAGNLINPYSKDSLLNEQVKAKEVCMKENNVKILRREDLLHVFNYINSKYSFNRDDNGISKINLK